MIVLQGPRGVESRLNPPRSSAVFVVATGIAVLIGWIYEIDALRIAVPGFLAMKPITAICLILAGSSLWLLSSEGRSLPMAMVLASAVALIGGMTLVGYLTGSIPGFEAILARDPNRVEAVLSRCWMNPTTALNLVLLATALILLGGPRRFGIAQGLAIMAGVIAATVLVGYVYGSRNFPGVAQYMEMAVHTTVAIIVLSIGVLLARPDRGLMTPILADTAGGLIARQMLPVAFLVPFVLNWLSVLAQNYWSWDGTFGAAARVSLSVMVYLAFVCRSSHLLHRIDLERRRVSEWLCSAHGALEARVTEQAAIEAELRASEHRYRFLADAMPQIVWTARPDGALDYYNRRWFDYSGTSFEEASGWGWKPVLHPEDLEHCVTSWTRALKTGQPFEIEYRFRRASDGAYRWHLGRAVPMRDESGTILKWIGTSTDIDDQKRAEVALRSAQEELELRVRERTAELASANAGLRRQVGERIKVEERLRREELRYRSLVEAMTAIVWDTSTSGEFKTEQPGWSAFTGQSFAELAGWGWLDAVHPGDRARTAWLWNEAVAGRSVYEIEHRLRRHDGTYRYMLARAVPIRGENGQGSEWIGVHTDIDEQVRAKEAMREAKEAAEAATRAKGEFLANMSHEIRTPMNGILGMTELTLETELSSRQRENLCLVRSSAEALLRVIDDILDFSKIEAGKLNLDLTPFALRACVDETLKTLALRAREKGIALSSQIAPDVPDGLIGDAGRLRQVIVNLVGNAIKFTHCGHVVLSVERTLDPGEELTLHLKVHDTGIGISPEKLRTIFEPFIQADGSTTRQYGGTGLGLSICRKLAELMGGQLWAESELGRGSTFHFTVRLGVRSGLVGEAAVPSAELAISCGVRRLTILLAEDQLVNQKVVTTMLERLGHRIRVVGDGRMAVEAALQETYDLVLMDVQMPVMDGFEATAALRIAERGTGRHLPIVALTAHAMKGDRERCLASGFDAYVPKPIRRGVLLAAINSVVGTSTDGSGASAPDPVAPGGWGFDLGLAMKAFGGDEELFLEIVDLFLEDCPKLMKELRDAIDANDAAALRRTAHALKGAASHLFAEAVNAPAERLESVGRTGSCVGAREEFDELEKALACLSRTLARDRKPRLGSSAVGIIPTVPLEPVF